MSIQRFETGPRMSQVVVNGNTIYLAGVVANKTAGGSVTDQTKLPLPGRARRRALPRQ